MLQDKEEEIETVKKEMRGQEHGFRKAQIELENERNYWKTKTETLQQDYSSKPLIKLAHELQERLSEKEREILALKQSELALKRELFQLKELNLHLKNANSLLISQGNYRPKSVCIDMEDSVGWEKKGIGLAIKLQPSSNRLRQIDEKAEFSPELHPTHELLFSTIRALKEEKEALEDNMNKIKEVAIESVVEKEKELIEWKNKCEEIEITAKNQLELYSGELEVLRRKLKYVEGDEETSSPKHAASLMELRKLENELQTMKKLAREEKVVFLGEKEALEAKILELVKENETQEAEFKRRIEKLQREMDDQIYAKVREDTQNSKDLQQEMLKELQLAEEKYRELQRKYNAVQVEMRTLQASQEKELVESQSRFQELSVKLKAQEGQDQKQLDSQKKYEGEKRKLVLELEAKQERIRSLEALKMDLMKRVAHLEGENTQVKMKNVLLKESCDNLKGENEDLKYRNNEELRHFQSSIVELDLKYSQEKDFLERELKRMKEMYEPEGRGTVVFGTLRADLNESTMDKASMLLRPSDQSPRYFAFSPSPMARVSILEVTPPDDVPRGEDLDRAFAESDLYLDLKSQLDDKAARVEGLEEENRRLLEQIERVKESYQKEIDSLREDQRTHLSNLQEIRKTFILRSDESPSSSVSFKELDRVKNENLKLVGEINESKQIHENELAFLKEELEETVKKMVSYKENFNKIVSERDLYMQRLSHVMGYIRKKRAEREREKEQNEGFFGIRLSLFRR